MYQLIKVGREGVLYKTKMTRGAIKGRTMFTCKLYKKGKVLILCITSWIEQKACGLVRFGSLCFSCSTQSCQKGGYDHAEFQHTHESATTCRLGHHRRYDVSFPAIFSVIPARLCRSKWQFWLRLFQILDR